MTYVGQHILRYRIFSVYDAIGTFEIDYCSPDKSMFISVNLYIPPQKSRVMGILI